MKTSRRLERYFKGAANHWRIDILRMVSKSPALSLDDMAERLEGNIKTISEHTRRLVHAGLLNKKYQGTRVFHSLSPYGEKFVDFIKLF